MTTQTAKEQIKALIDQQPDDSDYEELVRELAFSVMVQRGLADAESNRTISNAEMQRRIQLWQQ